MDTPKIRNISAKGSKREPQWSQKRIENLRKNLQRIIPETRPKVDVKMKFVERSNLLYKWNCMHCLGVWIFQEIMNQ